jgi:hypothetical protein
VCKRTFLFADYDVRAAYGGFPPYVRKLRNCPG